MPRRMLRHRRVEDVEYWRQRAGWFDDDAAMKDYNNGVYDTYFHGEGSGNNGDGTNVFNGANGSTIATNTVKILVVGLCAIMLIYMAKVFCNRMGGGSSGKKEKKRSSSSTRSRSKSRSKSRSRSRSRKRSSGDYKIMDDERSRRTSRSSRSKSRSRRSRSRSRARSKSRSRTEREKKAAEPVNPVLV